MLTRRAERARWPAGRRARALRAWCAGASPSAHRRRGVRSCWDTIRFITPPYCVCCGGRCHRPHAGSGWRDRCRCMHVCRGARAARRIHRSWMRRARSAPMKARCATRARVEVRRPAVAGPAAGRAAARAVRGVLAGADAVVPVPLHRAARVEPRLQPGDAIARASARRCPAARAPPSRPRWRPRSGIATSRRVGSAVALDNGARVCQAPDRAGGRRAHDRRDAGYRAECEDAGALIGCARSTACADARCAIAGDGGTVRAA